MFFSKVGMFLDAVIGQKGTEPEKASAPAPVGAPDIHPDIEIKSSAIADNLGRYRTLTTSKGEEVVDLNDNAKSIVRLIKLTEDEDASDTQREIAQFALRRYCGGEIGITAACAQAGLRKIRTRVERLVAEWKHCTPEERESFMQEIGLEILHSNERGCVLYDRGHSTVPYARRGNVTRRHGETVCTPATWIEEVE
jgi:hypothetical protein